MDQSTGQKIGKNKCRKCRKCIYTQPFSQCFPQSEENSVVCVAVKQIIEDFHKQIILSKQMILSMEVYDMPD